ncbi:unnamed protein product [Urochloa humidicola]
MDDLAALARGEGWTEERHAAFLDRVELSFVRHVLAGGDVVSQAFRRLGRRPPQLPLDRPLPDSAVESNRSGPAAAAARRRAASNDDARRPVNPAVGW